MPPLVTSEAIAPYTAGRAKMPRGLCAEGFRDGFSSSSCQRMCSKLLGGNILRSFLKIGKARDGVAKQRVSLARPCSHIF